MSLSHANMGSEPGLVANRRQYARTRASPRPPRLTRRHIHGKGSPAERLSAVPDSPSMPQARPHQSLHQSLQHQSLRSAHLLGIASQIWCNMVRYILVSSFLLSFTSVM